jgi:iron complex transport system substrate-binding protein
MRKSFNCYITLFAVLLLLCSCFRSGKGDLALNQQDSIITAARLLSMQRTADYTLVTVADPWKGGVLHRYVLVPRDAQLPGDLPEGTVVRTPVKNALVYSSVHTSLMGELGALDALRGVVDKQYFIDSAVVAGVAAGTIADCGNSMNPTVERVIDMQPDAILLSPYQDASYGQIAKMDIPLIECADYLEYDPLGRAEWVRFYGLLYGCEHEADSLFALVDSSYHALRHTVMPESRNPVMSESRHPNTAPKTSVLVDKVTGSVWYVPGGRSTIGQMLSDAGARYPWASDDRSGSIALPFETVLERAGDCDVWLLRYSGQQPLTRQQLLSEHRGYNQFRSFREGRVYGCNVEQSMFYEDSPFRPDLLLSDFIKILHPDIPDLPALRYYHTVE